MPNNDILRLLKCIELFQEFGVLEEEFRAMSDDDDIKTIDDLVRACKDGIGFWAEQLEVRACLNKSTGS